MINYSIEASKDEIKFWTDNKEFYEKVLDYIKTYADAISWRNRVEKVAKR